MAATRLRQERNREPLQSLVTGVISGFGALTYKSDRQRTRVPAAPAELISHSRAGPLDAGMGGSPWVGMQQEGSARGDEDEAKLLETTGLAPYPTREMCLLVLIS